MSSSTLYFFRIFFFCTFCHKIFKLPKNFHFECLIKFEYNLKIATLRSSFGCGSRIVLRLPKARSSPFFSSLFPQSKTYCFSRTKNTLSSPPDSCAIRRKRISQFLFQPFFRTSCSSFPIFAASALTTRCLTRTHSLCWLGE